MFKPTDDKGLFTNDSGFTLDFRHLLSTGYYFSFDQDRRVQVKQYLRHFQGNFVLEHWNKPEIKCGLWDSESNTYLTLPLASLKQPFRQLICYRLEIPYSDSIKPTYAIFYPDSKLIFHQGIYDIIPVSN